MSSIDSVPTRKRLGLTHGAAALLAGFIAGALPPPVTTVSAWAAEKRYIAAESGSPFPGKWDNALVPYGVEIQDCLSFTDPCRTVTFTKSAQVAGTEIGINLFGYCVDYQPCPVLIVLPSLDQASTYNKVKLQPTIEATPALNGKIKPANSRDENSSTSDFKRFRGGFLVVTGANSSKGLKMISARVRIYEEISDYPEDVDNQGDPLALGERAGKAWSERGPKTFYNSTPFLKGACRVTEKYEISDQRRYYVPCPHCGALQVLEWQFMRWAAETKPHGAFFECRANGCVIESHHKRAMIAAGIWIKTYPGDDANPAPPPHFGPDNLDHWRARSNGGRDPGFHIWQAYSPFVPWDDTVAEYFNAKDDPRKLKVFWQQGLGLAWEEKGEAPDHERLFERREKYPLRRILPGGLFLTGFADVQGDRLEYGVYAWGRHLSGWLIDKGVILGDPQQPAVWKQLDDIVGRKYEDVWGRHWPIDAFGVDTGYLSNTVYRWARQHAHEGRVFACDGRAGWRLPPIGSPKKIDVDFEGRKIGAIMLWPVGTFDMKSEVYASLRRTIVGPSPDGQFTAGYAHFPEACDREFFKQITAEHLHKRETRTGHSVLEWVKDKKQANEHLDIVVGARALARHLSDHLDPQEWDKLAAIRTGRPEDIQGDLASLWAPTLEVGAIGDALPVEPNPLEPPGPRVIDRSAGRTIDRTAGQRVTRTPTRH